MIRGENAFLGATRAIKSLPSPFSRAYSTNSSSSDNESSPSTSDSEVPQDLVKDIHELAQKATNPNISPETISEIEEKAGGFKSPDEERIHKFFGRLSKGKKLSKEELKKSMENHGRQSTADNVPYEERIDSTLPEFYRKLRSEIESDAQFNHRYEVVFLESESDDYLTEYLPYEYDVKADIQKIGHDPNSFGMTDEDPALAHWLDQISAPIKDTLSMKNTSTPKRYKRIMRAFSVADYRDNPAYVASSGNCWIWIEEGSKQEKLLVQLGNHVPPMMWIPIRPNKETLKRLFDEVTSMEAGGAGQIMEQTDEMLTKINFNAEDIESTTKQSDFFKYINNSNPEDHKDLHSNSLTMFLGNTDDVRTMEQSFMNNPYVFNTPVILGSSNRHTRGTPVIISKFRTTMTRSMITLVARYDFQLQLAAIDEDSTWNVPVFAIVNYPDNKLISRPVPQRINRQFDTYFPEDTPMDVIGALLPYKMRTWKSVRDFIEGMKEEEVPPQIIAHLAVLGDPNFEEIFHRYESAQDPVYRLACVMGASHLGRKDLVEQILSKETKEEIRDMMSKYA